MHKMNSITDTITRRIRAKGRGWVFTPKDFLDVAQHVTVNKILSRLTNDDTITRLDQGIYYFPDYDDRIGMLSPAADKMARAIAARTGMKIFTSGAAATNYLGLSTQVPAKVVYATNSPSRKKTINGRTIIFQKAKVPIIDNVNDKINLFIQAFSYLGKNGIDSVVLQQSARRLSDKDIKDLIRVIPQIPAWMADIIFRIQQVKYGQIRISA